jgi:hypothetical protein
MEEMFLDLIDLHNLDNAVVDKKKKKKKMEKQLSRIALSREKRK